MSALPLLMQALNCLVGLMSTIFTVNARFKPRVLKQEIGVVMMIIVWHPVPICDRWRVVLVLVLKVSLAHTHLFTHSLTYLLTYAGTLALVQEEKGYQKSKAGHIKHSYYRNNRKSRAPQRKLSTPHDDDDDYFVYPNFPVQYGPYGCIDSTLGITQSLTLLLTHSLTYSLTHSVELFE
jgi:hypothetical protein